MSMFRNLMGAGLRRRDPLHGIHYVLDLDAHGRSNSEEEPERSTWTDRATGKMIDLHNFSFGGGSGWNGYACDFKNWSFKGTTLGLSMQKSYGRLHLTFTSEYTGDYSIGMAPAKWDLTKDRTLAIKSTYPEGTKFKLSYYAAGSDRNEIEIPANGRVTLPANPDSSVKVIYFNFISIRSAGTIDIEQLPLYPGALVFDGVDDYGATREAVTEQVGTVLAMYRMLSLKDSWHYLLDTRNDTGADRLYIGSNSSTSLWVNATIAGFKPPIWPYDTALNIQSSVGSAAIAAPVMVSGSKVDSLQPENVALYRLILIEEQLTDEQARLLKERVLAEHNAWLADNGYDDYIEDIAI